jgi:hypothetical protein
VLRAAALDKWCYLRLAVDAGSIFAKILLRAAFRVGNVPRGAASQKKSVSPKGRLQ